MEQKRFDGSNEEFGYGEVQEEYDFEDRDFGEEFCGCSVCAQCGYRFARSDDVLEVHETGDLVHKECFIDYADDNVNTLASVIELC